MEENKKINYLEKLSAKRSTFQTIKIYMGNVIFFIEGLICLLIVFSPCYYVGRFVNNNYINITQFFIKDDISESSLNLYFFGLTLELFAIIGLVIIYIVYRIIKHIIRYIRIDLVNKFKTLMKYKKIPMTIDEINLLIKSYNFSLLDYIDLVYDCTIYENIYQQKEKIYLTNSERNQILSMFNIFDFKNFLQNPDFQKMKERDYSCINYFSPIIEIEKNITKKIKIANLSYDLLPYEDMILIDACYSLSLEKFIFLYKCVRNDTYYYNKYFDDEIFIETTKEEFNKDKEDTIKFVKKNK